MQISRRMIWDWEKGRLILEVQVNLPKNKLGKSLLNWGNMGGSHATLYLRKLCDLSTILIAKIFQLLLKDKIVL